MSARQTKRKNSNSLPVTISKDRFIKFIKDDLSSTAINQINSLVRRREFTKKFDYYNERIREVLLYELQKRSVMQNDRK